VSTAGGSNYAHSVFQRLLNYAKAKNEDFNLLLIRYGLERLLYRLSISPHSDRFVLKGANLFLVWTGCSHRTTKDADLLAIGPANREDLTSIFKELCRLDPDAVDGILFLEDTVRAVPIREEQEHGGIRVTMLGTLHQARISLQIDVGFGDAVTPPPEQAVFPTLLDTPEPRLLICSRYTMIAEKLQAMIVLGIANSRMKDFYDLYILAREFEFDGETLSIAIRATFERRNTQIPVGIPLALTERFGQDETKSVQWRAFIRKGRLKEVLPSLSEVLSHLPEFLLPPLRAASGQAEPPGYWSPGGPWSSAPTATGDT
jgi:hypothetical protein